MGQVLTVDAYVKEQQQQGCSGKKEEPGGEGEPSTGRQRHPERAVPQHPARTRVVVGTQPINNSVIIRKGEVKIQVQVHLRSPVSMSGQQ